MAVLYGVAANASISKVMLTGLGPGLLFCVMMMVYNHYICTKHGWDPATRFSVAEVARSFRASFVSLMIPVILVGGICAGVFTPTEAAGAAVLFVLAAELVLQRRLALASLKQSLLITARLSGSVLFILATASLVAFVMTVDGIPRQLTQLIATLSTDRTVVLLMINAILFVAGMFLDPVAGIIIFVPLLLPTIKMIGVDTLHFGVIVMVNLACGLLTPPVGSVLFITSAVTRLPIERLVFELLPFYGMLMLLMLVVTFVPELSLWLPRQLFD
jgi:tripartite ATP-independent transporter DctM subunit